MYLVYRLAFNMFCVCDKHTLSVSTCAASCPPPVQSVQTCWLVPSTARSVTASSECMHWSLPPSVYTDYVIMM